MCALAAFAAATMCGTVRADEPQTNATPARIKVACLGDSITRGAYAVSNNYPKVLQRLLGDGYKVTNYGLSGSNGASKGNPWRNHWYCGAALKAKADVVIWMHGTNDGTHWDRQGFTDDWFVADVKELLNQFLANKPKQLIIVTSPTLFYRNQGGVWGNAARVLDDHVIPATRRIANDLDATLVDFYEMSSTHRADWYANDRIHLCDAGYEALARAIFEKIAVK